MPARAAPVSLGRAENARHTFPKPTPRGCLKHRDNEKPDTVELVKNFPDETGKGGNPGRFTLHLEQVERPQSQLLAVLSSGCV